MPKKAIEANTAYLPNIKPDLNEKDEPVCNLTGQVCPHAWLANVDATQGQVKIENVYNKSCTPCDSNPSKL